MIQISGWDAGCWEDGVFQDDLSGLCTERYWREQSEALALPPEKFKPALTSPIDPAQLSAAQRSRRIVFRWRLALRERHDIVDRTAHRAAAETAISRGQNHRDAGFGSQRYAHTAIDSCSRHDR